MVIIYRQEIMADISLFTAQPKAKFYEELFAHLDLSCIPSAAAKTGRKGFDSHSFICAFIVMKAEFFTQITDLLDYLNNNLIIAYYCGFNIMKPLPSYWTFARFIKNFDHALLQKLMQSEVLKATRLSLIDTSFIALDATPVHANTSQNNPKSFKTNKFSKNKQPKADKDCRLGVHTASNQHNERKFEYYWGYKNHIVVDCISGLPIFEITTPANIYDSTVALDILSQTNEFLSLKECSFIADKGYDVKAIYNTVRNVYEGDCFIPLNKRNTKDVKLLPMGVPLCDAGFALNRDGKCHDRGRIRQKFCCPFKLSKNDTACTCNHPNYHNGKKHRGCVKWVTIPDDYRLSIDRTSIQFKSVYALRTEVERYNSRFKQTGCERVFVRNEKSVANLNTIAHITLLAVALATVITQKNVSYRCMKSTKRIA